VPGIDPVFANLAASMLEAEPSEPHRFTQTIQSVSERVIHMSAARVTEIRKRLEAALDPTLLEIEDQSHLHVGHEGAKSGGGHFAVHIQAAALEGLSRIKQHRMIYAALDEMMGAEIHALSIRG
jgi:BolA protein